MRKREVAEYGSEGVEVQVVRREMDEKMDGKIPVEEAWEVGRVTGGQVVVVKGAGHGFVEMVERRGWAR